VPRGVKQECEVKPQLRFKRSLLVTLDERHGDDSADNALTSLKRRVADRGCLAWDELREVARWKAMRSAGYMEENTPEYVQEITGIALQAKEERVRIEVLTLLDGVGWPTASVILHFFHKDPYPILDFRALWSLSLEVPNEYDFTFWWTYVECCRQLANESGLTMRRLDQALWQYSKEKQK